MNQSQDACARFGSLLAEYLQGDLPSSELTWMADHRDRCARCMDALQAAAETEALLVSWVVPGPPGRLRERVLRQILSDRVPERVDCSDLRAELSAWCLGDLPPRRADALSKHSERCARCARQVQIAERVDRWLASWAAPEPQAGFRERILAALDRTRAADTSAVHRRMFTRPLAAFAAAALVVLVAYLGLRDRESEVGPKQSAEQPVQDLLARYQREVRLRAVSTEQFPGGIGSFDHQPLVLDRGRRISGNAFHRSLRRTLAHTALHATQTAAGSTAPAEETANR